MMKQFTQTSDHTMLRETAKKNAQKQTKTTAASQTLHFSVSFKLVTGQLEKDRKGIRCLEELSLQKEHGSTA